MSDSVPIRGFSRTPEVYDKDWSTKPIEASKLVQYLAFDRMVRLSQWDVPPRDLPFYHIVCRAFKMDGLREYFTTYYDSSKKVSATMRYREVFREKVELLLCDESKNISHYDASQTRLAQIFHRFAAQNIEHEDYIKLQEGHSNMVVRQYPKNHQLAILQQPANADNTLRQGEGFWYRAQLCTNRTAAEICRKIIMNEAHLQPLPKPFDRPSNHLNAENKMYHWATVIQERWAPHYKRVTVMHKHDETVVAYFRKTTDKNDKRSTWKITSKRDFYTYATNRDDLRSSTWEFWVEEDGMTASGLFRKGPGTMYVRRDDTGLNYYVNDPEYGSGDVQSRKESVLPMTFPAEEGTWKMARVLSFHGEGDEGQEPSVELWLCIHKDGHIIKRLAAKKIREDSEQDASKAYYLPHYPGTLFHVKILGFCKTGYGSVGNNFQDAILLEYCPGGDLRALMQEFKKRGRHLPEGFMWLLLEVLTLACSAIEEEGKVHPMITLENLLLREKPGLGTWPAYPSPALGGLGSLEDKDNISGKGEEGFSTPEQIFARTGQRIGDPAYYVDDSGNEESDSDRRKAVSGSKLHVCAIGICVWSTMRLRNGLPVEFYDGDTIHSIDDTSTYSSCLEELVADCLEPTPQLRMSLDQLVTKILAGKKALRRMKPQIDSIIEDSLPIADRIPVPEDEFAVWTLFDHHAEHRADQP